MSKKNMSEVEIAEQKANEAIEKFNKEKEKLDRTINNLNLKINNKKLENLENIIGVKINEYNKNRTLPALGFDSLKIYQISKDIENIIEINLNLSSVFTLTLGDFANLTKNGTKEYNLTIKKMEEIKDEQYVNHDPLTNESDTDFGYCSFLIENKMIDKDEFDKIKTVQLKILRGDLGITKERDMKIFINMSRKCVKKLKENDDLGIFKKEFNLFRKELVNNSELEVIYEQWCKFNAKIIINLDPELDYIPDTTEEINTIFKYL